jgi:hypothetical protein
LPIPTKQELFITTFKSGSVFPMNVFSENVVSSPNDELPDLYDFHELFFLLLFFIVEDISYFDIVLRKTSDFYGGGGHFLTDCFNAVSIFLILQYYQSI